jgi:hypothetical protein
VVDRAEGIAGGLAVAYEFSVDGSLLRAQMVTQDLVETLQTDAFRFFFLIIANLRAAPDTLDHERLLAFSLSLSHPSSPLLLLTRTYWNDVTSAWLPG